jgi:nucleoside phosphorylase
MGMSESKPIGIVMATRMEADPVIRALGFQRLQKNLYRKQKPAVLLAISGVGRERARQAAMQLCDQGAKELISAGLCGALIPELKIGDLIIDRIATVDQAVVARVDRERLAQKAGAQAVDMETQAVIEAGTRRGVPIRVLRVIGDTYEDNLAPLYNSDKAFSKWRIALRLMNPRTWPLAAKLRRQSQIATQQLVQALSRYLEISLPLQKGG